MKPTYSTKVKNIVSIMHGSVTKVESSSDNPVKVVSQVPPNLLKRKIDKHAYLSQILKNARISYEISIQPTKNSSIVNMHTQIVS